MRNYLSLSSGSISRAKELRRNATEAEKRLWKLLREAFPQARFRRQVPYGPYFAEFLSVRGGLIIEADGGQHAMATEHDAARARYFAGEGFRTLRFWNNDILENGEGVIATVADALKSFSQREKEGAAFRRRKDEGEQSALIDRSASPSHSRLRGNGPLPLPQGEGSLEGL